MDVHEWLEKTQPEVKRLPGPERWTWQANRPPAVCADGFHLSIQASDNHRCVPQMNGRGGNYAEVEVATCRAVPGLTLWGSGYERVYSFVPIKGLNVITAMHGGIVGTKEEAEAQGIVLWPVQAEAQEEEAIQLEPEDAAEKMTRWQMVADSCTEDALDGEDVVARASAVDSALTAMSMAAKYAAVVQAQAALRQAAAAEKANELAAKAMDAFGTITALEAEVARLKAHIRDIQGDVADTLAANRAGSY